MSNTFCIITCYFPILFIKCFTFCILLVPGCHWLPFISAQSENQLVETLNLFGLRQYITMSITSAFIFVKVTLSLHRTTVLSAALFEKSALRRHATIRLTLTEINLDMMLMLMDYPS